MTPAKTLTRSRYDKILGGVAGGLAQYLEMDSAIVRFLFILVTLVFGTGIWVYLILWIILPYEPIKNPWMWDNPNTPPPDEESKYSGAENPAFPRKMRRDSNMIIGVVLIILGIIFLLGELLPSLDFDKLWPTILIIVGGVLIYNYYTQNQPSSGENNQNPQ